MSINERKLEENLREQNNKILWVINSNGKMKTTYGIYLKSNLREQRNYYTIAMVGAFAAAVAAVLATSIVFSYMVLLGAYERFTKNDAQITALDIVRFIRRNNPWVESQQNFSFYSNSSLQPTGTFPNKKIKNHEVQEIEETQYANSQKMLPLVLLEKGE